jgi:hypothetical protein
LSYNFGISYKNYFYYLIPAYTDFLKKISPGKLLLYKILDWCYKNNINVLDFGQGEEEYKKRFTDKYNYLRVYVKYFPFLLLPLLVLLFLSVFVRIEFYGITEKEV